MDQATVLVPHLDRSRTSSAVAVMVWAEADDRNTVIARWQYCHLEAMGEVSVAAEGEEKAMAHVHSHMRHSEAVELAAMTRGAAEYDPEEEAVHGSYSNSWVVAATADLLSLLWATQPKSHGLE